MIINCPWLLWFLYSSMISYKYSNTNANHNFKNIATPSFTYIPPQINVVDASKFFCYSFAEAIKSKAINKAIIAHKANNSIASLQTVSCPTKELDIGVA